MHGRIAHLEVFLDGEEGVGGSAPVRWLLVLLEERLEAFVDARFPVTPC